MTEKWRLVNQLQILKKLRREQQKRAIIDMCIFYSTTPRYLTRHLPFPNELLYDLTVLHPLMLKEDQACQVICRTAKKLSQIIRQHYVDQLTNEWKIYQGAEDPRGLALHWTSRRWVQYLLKSLPLLEKSVHDTKTQQVYHTIVYYQKLVKAYSA